MTNETKQAPEVIYLQSCCDDPECTCQFNEWDDVTWCKDKIHDRDVKYIRADHIEDVRGMVPVYQIRPDCENWIDCTEKYYAEWKGDKRTLYTQPADYSGEFKTFILDVRKEIPKNSELFLHQAEQCAKCAEVIKERDEFESCLREIGFLVDFDHNGGLAQKVEEKLAALEAENTRLTEQLHALSRTVMSDQVSNDSHSLFIAAIRDLAAINEALELDPDDGGAVPIIDAIDELKATTAQQAEQLAAAEKDAERIDTIERLFFEHQWNGVVGSGSLTHWRIVGSYRHTAAKMEGVTFREAIDAAIAAQKGEKHGA